MRSHGTHVCYVHGPAPGAGKGCRCEPCRAANAAYEAERKQRVAPAYVGADTVRQHIRFLAEQGVGLKTLAARSGVAHGALWKIVYGVPSVGRPPSRRVRVETQAKILAVSPADRADGARVPAGPTWAIVDQLLERGWQKAAIFGRAIGQSGRALQLGGRYVTAANARAVAALLDEPVPPRRSRFGLHEVEQPAEAERTYDDVLPAPLRIDDISAAPWRKQAACRLPNVPAWIFFPGRGDMETTAAAMAVCDSCPVKSECLDAHLHERFGIWGGTTERQRRAVRRERGLEDDDQDDESEAA